MADSDEEKRQYIVDDKNIASSDHENGITEFRRGSVAVGEAAALYGDVETAESRYTRETK